PPRPPRPPRPRRPRRRREAGPVAARQQPGTLFGEMLEPEERPERLEPGRWPTVPTDGRYLEKTVAGLHPHRAGECGVVPRVTVRHEELRVVEGPPLVAHPLIRQAQQELDERLLVIVLECDEREVTVDVRDVVVGEVPLPAPSTETRSSAGHAGSPMRPQLLGSSGAKARPRSFCRTKESGRPSSIPPRPRSSAVERTPMFEKPL